MQTSCSVWGRLYQQGLLEVREAGVAMAMLPVMDASSRKRRVRRARSAVVAPRKSKAEGLIEIRFPNGGQMRLPASVDTKALAHLIELLVRS